MATLDIHCSGCDTLLECDTETIEPPVANDAEGYRWLIGIANGDCEEMGRFGNCASCDWHPVTVTSSAT
jgi:hypothetical protein